MELDQENSGLKSSVASGEAKANDGVNNAMPRLLWILSSDRHEENFRFEGLPKYVDISTLRN
jgi:hypothetical protein